MNATNARDVEADVFVIGAGTTELVVDVVAASPTARYSNFDDFLARFKDEIYRYAARLTGNRAEADDLYQQTLLDAYRAFDRMQGSENQRAWLYTLATKVFMNDRHLHGRERPIDEVRAREIPGATVEAFVADLPRDLRVALVQRMFHDRSYAEIADSLSCSEAVARASVYSALRTLRHDLEEQL